MPTVAAAPRAHGDWWAIAAGGAVGTAARAVLTWTWPAQVGAWPIVVLGENVAGAFALGLLLGWLGRLEGPSRWRSPFFTTGVLGSFTTFSALAFDVAALGGPAPWLAVGYAAASLVLGLAVAAAGWLLGRGRARP